MEVPDALPNYTGPYISDGKFQTSVEFGSAVPRDELDALSRLHDSAYAKYSDSLHRYAADSIYNEEAKKLVGKFPELARFLVLYGNQAQRSFANIAESVKTYSFIPGMGPIIGLVVGGVRNMLDMNAILEHGARAKAEVKAYYKTDPVKLAYRPMNGSIERAQSEYGNKRPEIPRDIVDKMTVTESGAGKSDQVDLGSEKLTRLQQQYPSAKARMAYYNPQFTRESRFYQASYGTTSMPAMFGSSGRRRRRSKNAYFY